MLQLRESCENICTVCVSVQNAQNRFWLHLCCSISISFEEHLCGGEKTNSLEKYFAFFFFWLFVFILLLICWLCVVVCRWLWNVKKRQNIKLCTIRSQHTKPDICFSFIGKWNYAQFAGVFCPSGWRNCFPVNLLQVHRIRKKEYRVNYVFVFQLNLC